MKSFKKCAVGSIFLAAAVIIAVPASAEWRRVGPYGGNDLYPSLGGCTLGGWVCSQVKIKKSAGGVTETATNSGERKAGSSVGGTEKIYCTDGNGNYKSANKGCGGKWKPVDMGNQ